MTKFIEKIVKKAKKSVKNSKKRLTRVEKTFRMDTYLMIFEINTMETK
tara:strand:- start:3124 stop:3267 length:144 start_codon:yes stop_codon:yes gene_type:complete